MKVSTQRSLRSLIMSRNSILRISKSRIQYGKPKGKSGLVLMKFSTHEFSRSPIMIFNNNFYNFPRVDSK